MKERDYLWCALHMILDHEEELDRFCPDCRMQAECAGCPVCGKESGKIQTGENKAFDMEEYRRQKEGAYD